MWMHYTDYNNSNLVMECHLSCWKLNVIFKCKFDQILTKDKSNNFCVLIVILISMLMSIWRHIDIVLLTGNNQFINIWTQLIQCFYFKDVQSHFNISIITMNDLLYFQNVKTTHMAMTAYTTVHHSVLIPVTRRVCQVHVVDCVQMVTREITVLMVYVQPSIRNFP